MQYSKEYIEGIRDIYIKPPYPSINKISTMKKIYPKTVYRWRIEYDWDLYLIEQAKTMYIEGQQSIKEIARVLSRSQKVIREWKDQGKWDKEKFIIGGIGLSRELAKKFREEVQTAINEGTIAEPGVTDKLTKLLKVLEKLSPQRVQLSNIYHFLKDLTDFVCTLGDREFSKGFQKYLPEISDYLREKYAGQ